MTSSLVGSEMCIRDRCYSTSDPPCWTFKMGQRYSRIDYVLVSRSLATVSYTHLTLPTICSV
eukprot:8247596-Prorocentrum_lima.AAC.1